MKHLIGGSKDQWPPVGKSSDTPKEVKIARREEIPPVLGKPANMGLDAFIIIRAIPVTMSRQSKMTEYMECTSCELRKAIVKRIPDLGINEKCSRHW